MTIQLEKHGSSIQAVEVARIKNTNSILYLNENVVPIIAVSVPRVEVRVVISSI